MRTLTFGGQLAGPPSACSCGPSRLDVFAVGADKHVWHWWLEGATWLGPESLSSGPAQFPAEGLCAVSSGSGRVEVFAAGTGNTPWWWRGRNNGNVWDVPIPLPGAAGGIHPVPVAAVCSGPDSIEVFAAGPGNTPWWWRWNGASWGAPPTPLPSAGTGIHPVRIAAVSAAPGRLDVFAAGGNQLWHWWLEPSGWRVEPLGGALPAEGVSAVSWGPNRIDVFAAGQGGGANSLAALVVNRRRVQPR